MVAPVRPRTVSTGKEEEEKSEFPQRCPSPVQGGAPATPPRKAN